MTGPTIAAMQKHIEELKRRAGQGSQQLQDEGVGADLEGRRMAQRGEVTSLSLVDRRAVDRALIPARSRSWRGCVSPVLA
jgi:hypothetical protein